MLLLWNFDKFTRVCYEYEHVRDFKTRFFLHVLHTDAALHLLCTAFSFYYLKVILCQPASQPASFSTLDSIRILSTWLFFPSMQFLKHRHFQIKSKKMINKFSLLTARCVSTESDQHQIYIMAQFDHHTWLYMRTRAKVLSLSLLSQRNHMFCEITFLSTVLLANKSLSRRRKAVEWIREFPLKGKCMLRSTCPRHFDSCSWLVKQKCVMVIWKTELHYLVNPDLENFLPQLIRSIHPWEKSRRRCFGKWPKSIVLRCHGREFEKAEFVAHIMLSVNRSHEDEFTIIVC